MARGVTDTREQNLCMASCDKKLSEQSFIDNGTR